MKKINSIQTIPASIYSKNNQTFINIDAKPGSKKDEILSISDESVYLSIKAQPVKGEANHAIIEYLSEVIQVKKTLIEIVKGQKSKEKLVSIQGISPEIVFTKLKSSMP